MVEEINKIATDYHMIMLIAMIVLLLMLISSFYYFNKRIIELEKIQKKTYDYEIDVEKIQDGIIKILTTEIEKFSNKNKEEIKSMNETLETQSLNFQTDLKKIHDHFLKHTNEEIERNLEIYMINQNKYFSKYVDKLKENLINGVKTDIENELKNSNEKILENLGMIRGRTQRIISKIKETGK